MVPNLYLMNEDKNEDEVNDKRENDINVNKTRYKQPIIIKKNKKQ